jgi:hypothetical protein
MNSVKCIKCGLVNFATAAECKRCGAPTGPAAAGAFAPSSGGGQAAPGGDAYYRLSGEVTVAGLFMGLGGGLTAGAVLAFAYSYLITYIPFVYLNFLCTIGYALVLGAVTGHLMRVGKMRNSVVGGSLGLIVALVSYYFSWAVWLSITVSGSDLSVSSVELAAQPGALWRVMQAVNENGAWSVGLGLSAILSGRGGMVSGVALWVVWVIEALIVLVGTTIAALGTLAVDPFCESCQTWCAEEKDVLSIRPADSGELTRRFEAKDFAFLKAVGAKSEGDAEWFRLDLHRCPGCGSTNTLSVKQERLKVDDKGKTSVDSKGLIQQLLLTEADVHTLRLISSEMRQTQPAV